MPTPESIILVSILLVLLFFVIIRILELAYSVIFIKDPSQIEGDGRIVSIIKKIDRYVMWVAIHISGAFIKGKRVRFVIFCLFIMLHSILIAVLPWPYPLGPAGIVLLAIIGIYRHHLFIEEQMVNNVEIVPSELGIDGNLYNEAIVAAFSVLIITSGILAHLQLEELGFKQIEKNDIFLYGRVLFFEILKSISIVDYYDLFGSTLSYSDYVGANEPSSEVKTLLFLFRIAFNVLLLGFLVKIIERHRMRAIGLDLRDLEESLKGKNEESKIRALNRIEKFTIYGMRLAQINGIDVIKRVFFYKNEVLLQNGNLAVQAHDIATQFGIRNRDGDILFQVKASLQSYLEQTDFLEKTILKNRIIASTAEAELYAAIYSNKIEISPNLDDKLASCAKYFVEAKNFKLSCRYFKAAAVATATPQPFDQNFKKIFPKVRVKIREYNREALQSARLVGDQSEIIRIVESHKNLISSLYFSERDMSCFKSKTTEEYRRDYIINKAKFFINSSLLRSRRNAAEFLMNVINSKDMGDFFVTPLERWNSLGVIIDYGYENCETKALSTARDFFRRYSFDYLMESMEESVFFDFEGVFLERKIKVYLGSQELDDIQIIKNSIVALENLVLKRLYDLERDLTSSSKRAATPLDFNDADAFPIFNTARYCATFADNHCSDILSDLNNLAKYTLRTLEGFRLKENVRIGELEILSQSFLDQFSKLAYDIEDPEIHRFVLSFGVHTIRHFRDSNLSAMDENSLIVIFDWFRVIDNALLRARNAIGEGEYAFERAGLLVLFEALKSSADPDMDDLSFIIVEIDKEIKSN